MESAEDFTGVRAQDFGGLRVSLVGKQVLV